MRIRESGCDSSIVLSKFKFNCDEVDKSIPDPLPQNLNHFLLIVGKPGSSKTTLLMNMICKRGKMYNKKFDRIYLFSPSLCTIDDCPFEDLPEDQKYEELSEDILEGVLEEIRDSGEKVLFIMDDVVNDMKKEARLEKLLCKVLMNRRHQCVVEDEDVVGGPDPLCHIPLPSSAPNTPQRGGGSGGPPPKKIFGFKSGATTQPPPPTTTTTITKTRVGARARARAGARAWTRARAMACG